MNPLLQAIEQAPAAPRPGADFLQPDLPPAPDPGHLWPFHLPAWNAIDCFWWSLLARAAYAPDATYMQRIARWAGPVVRLDYLAPQAPPAVGHAFIELPDQWLIVVPGTASEQEFLNYVMTHTLQEEITDSSGLFTVNSTWYTRARVVWGAALAWNPPALKPLVVVGHSSGGAAGGVAAYLAMIAYPLMQVAIATFGTPTWGSPSINALTNSTKSPQTIEFCNPPDPVVELPPPWNVFDLSPLARLLFPRPTFARKGVLLDLQGVAGVQPHPMGTFDRASSVFQGLLRGDLGLGSHAMAAYSSTADLWARDYCARTNQADLIVVLENIARDMTAANL